jgi:hypothetical protein
MKSILRLSACALSFLAFATTAHGAGPSANGDFQFALDGAAGTIQFDARTDADGASRGQMLFTADIEISNEDVDGTGAGGTPVTSIALAVDFDCLVVDGNRAVMSGPVASGGDYAGLPATLVVEDNDEGKNAGLDMFSWGIYRPTAITWELCDAELQRFDEDLQHVVCDDTGVGRTWIATDFERDDDVGIPSTPRTAIDCHSFPLSAYSLAEVPHGGGNIQVKN